MLGSFQKTKNSELKSSPEIGTYIIDLIYILP